MNISKIEQAKRIASYGFPILRLKPDSKEPISNVSFLEDATTDIDLIDFWFSEDPDLNYGVLGSNRGVVIDLDCKEEKNIDGLDTLIGVEIEENDALHERSFRVNTPSGGTHIYLRTHQPVSNAHNFGNNSGIDVRGSHGYVVGPGCTYKGIKYISENDISDIQYAPEWLVNKYLKAPGQRDEDSTEPVLELDRPENIELAKDFLKSVPPAIEGQNGNDHTYKVALELRDYGVSDYKCLQLIHNSEWNSKCEPPWDMEELEVVVNHVYKYGRNRPGEKADFMSLYETIVDIETQEQENVGVGDGSLDDHLFTPNKFKNRGKRRDYIIPEWLISHGFTAINAKRSMGKSTVLLDLACRIACGMDWQGTPMKEGYVSVYLCGEDDEGLELNINAWEVYHDRHIPDENMILSDRITNLMSAEDTEKWAIALKKKVGSRKAVIMMDTWQRASAFGGQNSDEDMQKCVAHAEALARILSGPAVVAFHPPKYSEHTIHGSAVIENSTTAIWQLEECVEGRQLKVTRIKGPGEGNFKKFKFHQVELDEKDSFGNNRKGLIPLKVAGTEDEGSEAVRARQEHKRACWAEAIRGVLEHELMIPIEERKKPFIKTVAQILQEKSKDTAFQNEYLMDLINIDVTSFNYKTVETELKNLFPVDSASSQVLKDGKVLSLVKEGKSRRIFKLSAGQAV